MKSKLKIGLLVGALLTASWPIFLYAQTLLTEILPETTYREKTKEILEVIDKGEYITNDYTVYIKEIYPVRGGLEIFLQAFEADEQIGFGEEGNVDIEKIRIFNPPVLVPDINGEIVKEYTDFFGKTHELRYTYDPYKATLEVLNQTIKLIGDKEGSIDSGTIGKTTSVFYSTAVGDGRVRASNATYATANAAATGDVATDNDVSFPVQNGLYSGTYYINRGFTPFDTSTLNDTDTIDSAVYALFIDAKTNPNSNSVSVVQTSQASPSSLATADFDAIGTTKGATDLTIASITTGAYNNFTLNATGLGWISKTGNTLLGTRITQDITATAPTGLNDINVIASDTEGTTNDPKLTVESSAPAATSTGTTTPLTQEEFDEMLTVSMEAANIGIGFIIFGLFLFGLIFYFRRPDQTK